jgi:hypothetical protein
LQELIFFVYLKIRKMKIISTILLVVFCSVTSMAQTRLATEAKGIVYDKERAVEFRLHTHGWALNYQIGTIKSYYKTSYYEFGLGELNSHKEVGKSTDPVGGIGGGSFRSYTYGKQNYAFMLRGGLGFKRYYSEKAAKNGVAVGILMAGGLTAAIMKPYYLEVGSTRNLELVKSIKYEPGTETLFLDRTKITGSDGLFKGLSESSIIPGAYGRVGVHLDWGAFDEFMKAIEVGIQVDIFPKRLPIMVPLDGVNENKPYFLNLYVSLQLGKRN